MGSGRARPGCWWAAAGPGRAIHSDLAPLVRRAPEGSVGLAAVPVGGDGAWQSYSQRPTPTGAKGTGGAVGLAAVPVGGDGAWQSYSQPPSPTGAKGTGGTSGPGCGARGRRQGLAGQRADTPSEARSADGSRADRRPRAQPAARPDSTPRGTRNTRGATSNQPGNPSNANTRQPVRAAARSRN